MRSLHTARSPIQPMPKVMNNQSEMASPTQAPLSLAELIIQSGQTTPLGAYQALIGMGAIRENADQARVVRDLERLHDALEGYAPAQPVNGWLGKISSKLNGKSQPEPPKGLYIHGGVGRGKSMLMDLFHQTATVQKRRRVHFHAFMLEVHDEMHRYRKTARQDDDTNVITHVADWIADSTWLLCFDEFHVTDITDAMILGRLFEALFARGVVVVATSNWPPDRLYEKGLQRELFLPFITMIKQRLDVIPLDHETDYRQARLAGMQTYLTPDDTAATATLDQAFDDLTRGAAPTPTVLTVKGRQLPVTRQAKGVARFSFDELCGQPLGSADYLAIARTYHTVILDHVPALAPQSRNEAKRLILLIDALYEAKRRLLLSSAVPVDQLYNTGDHSFEFERSVSRLMEMQSRDYLDQVAEEL